MVFDVALHPSEQIGIYSISKDRCTFVGSGYLNLTGISISALIKEFN